MSLRQDTVLPGHNPPGNLPDMSPEVRDIWSRKYISHWMDGEIAAEKSVVSPGRTELLQFFNGTVTAYDQSQEPQPVTWIGFPNLIKKAYGDDDMRWAIADASRMAQDEYLEWSLLRNKKTNDIETVTFTCEGPEYWQVFVSYQEQDFLKLVRDINPAVSKSMSDEDFFLVDPKESAKPYKVYNPANYWNIRTDTGSILHLLQPNNTLSAEIDIAAQGTVLRENSDGPVTDPDRLIKCSAYGNPGRNSDPVIGGTINSLASQGNIVSIADPVAIYMHKFDTSRYQLDYATTDDDGDTDLRPIKNPKEIFVWQRGNIDIHQGLRLMIRIPSGTKGKFGQDLTVSNIYDKTTGRHIKYAAQFADNINMGVSAVVIPGEPAKRISCYDPDKVTAASGHTPRMPTTQSFSLLAADGEASESRVNNSRTPFPFPKTVGRKYNW